MGQRIITAAIGLLILSIVFFWGGSIGIATAILLVSIIGMNELYCSFDNTASSVDNPYRLLGFLSAILLYLTYVLLSKNLMIVIFTVFSFLVITYGMLTYNKKTLSNISITILSMIYIPFSFCFIYIMYSNPSMRWFVGYIFVIAFGSDSFAYFAGFLFGKRKITPILSPNKTLEGFIGGALGCLFLVYIYTVTLSYFIPTVGFSFINIIKYTVFAFVGAFVSQIGDLLASAIKRTNGIKDYSNLMPGHGGILDRFDSVLLVSPYVYLVVSLFFI